MVALCYTAAPAPRHLGSNLTNAASPSSDLEPAPVWRRLAAFGYDLLLVAALVFCFTLMILAVRGGEAVPPGSPWFLPSLVGVALVYYSYCWSHGGQTVGMRAWRIRVVRDDGRGLGWGRAAARFAAGIVAALPVGLGLWWSSFDRRKRGWHDRWTGTRAVRVPSGRAGTPPP